MDSYLGRNLLITFSADNDLVNNIMKRSSSQYHKNSPNTFIQKSKQPFLQFHQCLPRQTIYVLRCLTTVIFFLLRYTQNLLNSGKCSPGLGQLAWTAAAPALRPRALFLWVGTHPWSAGAVWTTSFHQAQSCLNEELVK